MLHYRFVRQLRVAFWIPFLGYVYAAHPRERQYWRAWLAQTVDGLTAVDAAAPFMSFRAKEWLENFLADGDKRVFEWGAGGSTLFLASRARELVTIEHDPRWHQIVSSRLKNLGAANCVVLHIAPSTAPSPPIYRSDRKPQWFFEDYAKAIDNYPDGYFDLVIVDGRARPACLRHARPKVVRGGAILLDDSRRRRYQHAVREMDEAGWTKVDLSGVKPGGPAIHHTTAWIRPR